MLYLLVGPSGVGKSSIMAALQRYDGWKVVPTYTTRPARPDDVGRRSVTREEFTRLHQEGLLFTMKTLFGEQYGEDRTAIDCAQTNDGLNWCLDVAFTEREKFTLPRLRTAIVLPASEDQLKRQLEITRRGARLSSALNELEACENFVRSLPGDIAVRAIRNNPDEIAYAVEQLRAWALE